MMPQTLPDVFSGNSSKELVTSLLNPSLFREIDYMFGHKWT